MTPTGDAYRLGTVQVSCPSLNSTRNYRHRRSGSRNRLPSQRGIHRVRRYLEMREILRRPQRRVSCDRFLRWRMSMSGGPLPRHERSLCEGAQLRGRSLQFTMSPQSDLEDVPIRLSRPVCDHPGMHRLAAHGNLQGGMFLRDWPQSPRRPVCAGREVFAEVAEGASATVRRVVAARRCCK